MGTQDPDDGGWADRDAELEEFSGDPTAAPLGILLSEANDEPPYSRRDRAWASYAADGSAFSAFAKPATIGLEPYNADEVLDLVVEFRADGEQSRPFFRSWNDTLPWHVSAENPDLLLQEASLGVTTSGEPLENDVEEREQPVGHRESGNPGEAQVQ